MVHVASSATPRKNGGLVEMEEFSQFPEIDDVSDDHQATKKSREITSPARKVDQLRICGSSLTEHAPLFTPNGVYFICVTGGSGRAHLSVYSRQTAQLVRSMATRGGRVVRMVPNPRNRFQLYAACADGWIGLFDYEDGILLKVIYTLCSLFLYPISPFLSPLPSLFPFPFPLYFFLTSPSPLYLLFPLFCFSLFDRNGLFPGSGLRIFISNPPTHFLLRLMGPSKHRFPVVRQ